MSKKSSSRIVVGSAAAAVIAGVVAYKVFKYFLQPSAAPNLPKVVQPRNVQRLQRPGPVEAASEDSFPASDPPAWTGTGV